MEEDGKKLSLSLIFLKSVPNEYTHSLSFLGEWTAAHSSFSFSGAKIDKFINIAVTVLIGFNVMLVVKLMLKTVLLLLYSSLLSIPWDKFLNLLED